MLVLNILCYDLVGYESSRRLGTKTAECGYETPKPGNESSGYEKSMGTKRLVTVIIRLYESSTDKYPLFWPKAFLKEHKVLTLTQALEASSLQQKSNCVIIFLKYCML